MRLLFLLALVISNLEAQDLLLVDEFQLTAKADAVRLVLFDNNKSYLINNVQIYQTAVDAENANFYFYTYLPNINSDRISYVYYYTVKGEDLISDVFYANISDLIWDQESSTSLESKITDLKNNLEFLIAERNHESQKIRALKADAATVTEVNRLAAGKLNLRDLENQLLKLDQDIILAEVQLQQAAGMREPRNSLNRIRQLENALNLSRQELKTLQEQSFDPNSGASIEEKLKIIQETQSEDLGLLELELENLMIERQKLEERDEW